MTSGNTGTVSRVSMNRVRLPCACVWIVVSVFPVPLIVSVVSVPELPTDRFEFTWFFPVSHRVTRGMSNVIWVRAVSDLLPVAVRVCVVVCGGVDREGSACSVMFLD